MDASLRRSVFLISHSPSFRRAPVLTAAAYFLVSLVARFNAWEAARLRALSLEASFSLFHALVVCILDLISGATVPAVI